MAVRRNPEMLVMGGYKRFAEHTDRFVVYLPTTHGRVFVTSNEDAFRKFYIYLLDNDPF